jgi:hypothetical protein
MQHIFQVSTTIVFQALYVLYSTMHMLPKKRNTDCMICICPSLCPSLATCVHSPEVPNLLPFAVQNPQHVSAIEGSAEANTCINLSGKNAFR